MNNFDYDPQNNTENSFQQDVFQSMPPAPKNNAKKYAIASLVLGICAVFCTCICCCLYYCAIVLAVISIVMAFLARKENDKKMPGMAIAGIILAIVAIVFFLCWVGLEIYMNSLSEEEVIRMMADLLGMSYEEFMAEYSKVAGIIGIK
ncbi:MAG: DUF4190 domain-containing protein [Clostridia bacterium]|nr:DUF4190 domain-containing protein [Clostridia bacterium]